jgi:hypothetical protein
MIGSSDFFDFDISEQDNLSFFTKTNIKTVLGKNQVLNFVDKMNFELKMFDFSETALNIAEFYEESKNTKGIISFYQNQVIQMILYVIEDYPNLKKYLYERIFDNIEQDKIKCLDNTFKNNEEIYQKTQEQVNKFVEQKAIYEKQIKKIMKEKKCDRKTAELIYENEKLKKLAKKQGFVLPSFGVEFPNIPNITVTGIPKDVQNDNDIQGLPLPDKEIKMEEIIIDDTQIENSSDDENFWS